MSDPRIDTILVKLTNVESWQSTIESIDAKLTTIESEVTAIKVDVTEIREQLGKLRADLESAVQRITALEHSNTRTNTTMEALQNEVSTMKSEMNQLQQQALANDFTIHGLPPSFTTAQTQSLITKLAQHIGVSLAPQEFARAPFAVTNKTKTLSTVIGTFSNNTTKLNVFRACKVKRPIVLEDVIDLDVSSPYRGKELRIRNSLTTVNRTILAEALRTKGDLFKFAWDVNGRIFLKRDESSRGVEVKSLGDLQRIIAAARTSS